MFFDFHFFFIDRAPSNERVRDLSIFPGSLSTDGEGKKKHHNSPNNNKKKKNC